MLNNFFATESRLSYYQESVWTLCIYFFTAEPEDIFISAALQTNSEPLSIDV